MFVSELVLQEAAAGHAEASAKRLRGVPALRVTEDATSLAEALIAGGGLPTKATVDAFHIAIACAHGINYLLTWNCKHIANATMRATIEAICRSQGFSAPIVCTPEELSPETDK